MPTSQKRIEANRANAQRSTGPTSVEGKAVSRGNACKHGLAANVVAVPGEDQSELDSLREAWVEEIAPKSEVAAQFADRAFRALMRAQRADRAADAAIAARARRAEAVWSVQRAEEVQNAINELDDKPGVAVAKLKMTAEGAAWLQSAWRTLDFTLDAGAWSEEEYNRAVQLMGLVEVGHPSLFDDTRLLGDARRLCKEMGNVHTYHSITEEFIKRHEKNFNIKIALEIKALADPVYPRIKALVRAMIEELGALAKSLAPLSDLDRASAPSTCLIDNTDEGRLIERYRAAADRDLHRNHKAALAAETQAVVEAKNEPVAPLVESPQVAVETGEESSKSSAPNEPNATVAASPSPTFTIPQMVPNVVESRRPPSRQAV